MDFSRRTLLLGAGAGLTLVTLAACTEPTPPPTPTPTPPLRVPPPARIARTNWSADPFARGSGSYLPPGALPELRGIAAAPILDRVFFAGDWTSDEPTTLTGAARSGIAAADAVAAAAGVGERIAVLGAGLAGARAAASLASRGFDVVVVEGRDRVGGRIHTVDGDDAKVELGAWSLDAVQDEELVRALELDEVSMRALATIGYAAPGVPWQRYPSAGDEPADAAGAALRDAVAWAATQPADVDLLTALVESGVQVGPVGEFEGDAIIAQALTALASRAGTEAERLSAWFPPARLVPADAEEAADEEEPARGMLLPTGGLDALVRSSLEGLDVLLSTPVVGVGYSDEGVSLRFGTGESMSADRLVVTAPLGVLQPGVIEFDPPLPPSNRGALNALGVGSIELVRLGYDEPFWDEDAALWHLVGTDLPITTWVNFMPITGRPDLLGIVGGEPARALTELGDDAFGVQMRRNLEPFLP